MESSFGVMEYGIAVTSRNRAAKIKRQFGAVLTLQDVQQRNPLRFHKAPFPPHLRLIFEDYDGPDASIPGPTPEHAVAILKFADEQNEFPLLIHCNAGVSRSTAAALGILVQRLGNDKIDLAWRILEDIRPGALPNRSMLSHFDSALATGGVMRDEADQRYVNDPIWQRRSAEQNIDIEREFSHKKHLL